MLVDAVGLDEYILKLGNLPPRSFCGVDFETTGLKARKGDRAFLMGLSSDAGTISFFLEGPTTPLIWLFRLPKIRWAAHHAKFEASFLKAQFGIQPVGDWWCTEVFARVERNAHRSYSLQACAEREGWEAKYEPMVKWLEVNGPNYHLAPKEIIVPYVEQDADLSFRLAKKQLGTFRFWEVSPHKISPVVKLELATTKHLFAMEEAGICVDLDYCHRALAYERGRMNMVQAAFQAQYGMEFVDSAKALKPLFEKEGLPYGYTEKGNASFTAESLAAAGVHHPLVKWVLAHRAAQKRANTYWEGLIEHAHEDKKIHPNIRQCGAETFRMSITDPAAQTWPDDEEDLDCLYPIRRALIASPGNQLVSIDYSQMELRMMVDEAEDHGMIAAIQEGRDFHQELADRVGVKRGLAKNARFARLYGAGHERVGQTLGISNQQAKVLCNALDEQSPQITRYCRKLTQYARTSDYTYDWLGRRYFLDYGFEYKAPNYRIQGGCADILRIAIDDVAGLLKCSAKNTAMVLPIHDELVFDMHPQDLHLIPEIKRLMIGAHRSKKSLAMDVSVAIGPNLHDMESYAT